MIKGVGIDVVNIERFAKIVEQSPNFVERYFTFDETNNVDIHSIAAKFAAKEAFVKALNGLIRIEFKELQVLKHESGAPYLLIDEKLQNFMKNHSIHLSISHDGGIATAIVILESLV
jgi:holo-[acyl-carrier protein] synthase